MVTLAILRNNNQTMEMVNNNNNERPRKRQCRRVRFSEEEPQTRIYNNFHDAKTDKDRQALCEQVWYTREEFDALVEDRLNTIRMWRAVGGNTRLIEPHYCTRGLEMYESARLNSNVLAARADHIQAVLREQMRQKQMEGRQELNWEEMATAVSHRSAWAKRQASRLALRDALEAQDAMETTATAATSNDFAALDNTGYVPMMKRLSMPMFSDAGCGGNTMLSSISSRLSLPASALFGTSTSTCASTTSTRAPVDVQKLKEMNRQFLKSMTQQGNMNNIVNLKNNIGSKSQSKGSSSGIPRADSLALLLVRGRQHSLQNNPQQQQQQQNHSSSFYQQAAADLHLGLGIRRDSLHGILKQATQYST